MNLQDILQSAQGGKAIDNLAQQFGLSPQETQSAVNALLPALSMGFNKQAQNPGALSNILGEITSGSHTQMYDSDGDGIPDTAQTQGHQALNSLFGSKDVTNQVASQAANSTGISSNVLQQMLPVIATMVMGGVARQMQNQGFGGILGQLAGALTQGGQAGAAPGQAGGGPLGNILGGLLGGILGGGNQQQQTASPSSPAQPSAAAPQVQAGLDSLRNMFQPGTQVSGQHQSALQSILETMLASQNKR